MEVGIIAKTEGTTNTKTAQNTCTLASMHTLTVGSHADGPSKDLKDAKLMHFNILDQPSRDDISCNDQQCKQETMLLWAGFKKKIMVIILLFFIIAISVFEPSLLNVMEINTLMSPSSPPPYLLLHHFVRRHIFAPSSLFDGYVDKMQLNSPRIHELIEQTETEQFAHGLMFNNRPTNTIGIASLFNFREKAENTDLFGDRSIYELRMANLIMYCSQNNYTLLFYNASFNQSLQPFPLHFSKPHIIEQLLSLQGLEWAF